MKNAFSTLFLILSVNAQAHDSDPVEVREFLRTTRQCSPLWSLTQEKGITWVNERTSGITSLNDSEKVARILFYESGGHQIQEKVFQRVRHCLLQMATLYLYLPSIIQVNRSYHQISKAAAALTSEFDEAKISKKSRFQTGRLIAAVEILYRELNTLPQAFLSLTDERFRQSLPLNLLREMADEANRSFELETWIQFSNASIAARQEIQEIFRLFSTDVEYQLQRQVYPKDDLKWIAKVESLMPFIQRLSSFSALEAIPTVYSMAIQTRPFYLSHLDAKVIDLHNHFIRNSFSFDRTLSEGYLKFHLDAFKRNLTSLQPTSKSVPGYGSFDQTMLPRVAEWLSLLAQGKASSSEAQGNWIVQWVQKQDQAWTTFERRSHEALSGNSDSLRTLFQSSEWSDWSMILRGM